MVTVDDIIAHVRATNPHLDYARNALNQIPFRQLAWDGPITVDVNDARLPELHPASKRDVARYSRLKTEFPAIVLERRGPKFVLHDGAHRLAAARQRGDSTIKAFVGTSKSAHPVTGVTESEFRPVTTLTGTAGGWLDRDGNLLPVAPVDDHHVKAAARYLGKSYDTADEEREVTGEMRKRGMVRVNNIPPQHGFPRGIVFATGELTPAQRKALIKYGENMNIDVAQDYNGRQRDIYASNPSLTRESIVARANHLIESLFNRDTNCDMMSR